MYYIKKIQKRDLMVNYTPKIVKNSKNKDYKDKHELILIKDLITKSFLSLSPEDPILEAQEKLLKQNLPGSPVIDLEGNIVGFLSERDCLIRIVKMKYLNDISIKVKDLMSNKCFTVDENENIMKAIEAFSEKSFHILPVVDTNNKLVGIITRHAVFRYIVSLKQQTW